MREGVPVPVTVVAFGPCKLKCAAVSAAAALPPITLTAFAAHALSGIVPSLSAGLMAVIVENLSGWVIWVANLFGNLSFASLPIPPFSAYWMAPYYLAFLMIWRPRARPGQRLCARVTIRGPGGAQASRAV